MAAPLQPLPLSAFKFYEHRPFIISGPCGVESEEQIFAIAKELKNLRVHLLRGGIWKPRTRPDSFQGIGSVGLTLLKNAGKTYNLPVTVEVANPKHVEEALSAGIDILWIGARTTVNPFLVQEIANALKGVDIPIMVKNPVNPELDLWIGALERLNRNGINKLIAIHRGFSISDNSRYRNSPNWQIPIELKRRFPELPLICDPSHISGTSKLVSTIAQYAMDLNYDGLMIETHTDPEHALSDREQQLTPAELKILLDNLIIRDPSVDDIFLKNLLVELRSRIDEVDERILSLMSERMAIARDIGQYKRVHNMTILQVERWNEILHTRLKSGEIKELDREFIIQLYAIIHDESIRQQTYDGNNNEIEKKNKTEYSKLKTS
jgi:chorismate mutase